MQAERALLGQAGRVVATIAATVVAAYLVAATVRYGLIEREDLGLLCDTSAAPRWCSVRLLVIKAFLHDVFGLSSVVLAAAAAWLRSRSVYGFTWSGIGVLGGALVLARLQGQGQ